MARQTKALVQEAEALGIDVDGRWGDETIQEKIDEAAAARTAALTASGGDGDAADEEVADQPAEEDAVVLPLHDHGGDVVVVAEGPEAAAALKLQIEALTDGEGDQATSGEAGDAETGADELPAGGDGGDADADRLSGHAPDGVSATDGDQAPADDGAGGAEEPEAVGPASGDGDPAGSGGAPVVDGDGGADVLGNAEAAQDAAADHGDGSADGVSADEEAADRRLDDARQAMTRPIVAAYSAAGMVFGALSDDGFTGTLSYDPSWFSDEISSNQILALVGHAAPFVRQWSDAPAEALYGHVQSDGGLNLVLERPWSDLPLAERLAWRTFRDVLVTIDAGMKAEWKDETPERVARTIPIDETTLEEVDEPFTLTEAAGGPR
ncbi:hypothetical protein [Aureimonas sp. AU12]|uniref:hypothetical protein n=1 Tax=Aureimonas sp. AU12 TaxID=1638161 RepID=UPI000780AD22|nr:hypothetical protein [Aureimonas sp. AU12]